MAMRAERSVEGYQRVKQAARDLLRPFMDSRQSAEDLKRYWEACEVPHYPSYSFEETLAAFKDEPGQRHTLLSDMLWLANTIQGADSKPLTMPEIPRDVRDTYVRRFELQVSGGTRP